MIPPQQTRRTPRDESAWRILRIRRDPMPSWKLLRMKTVGVAMVLASGATMLSRSSPASRLPNGRVAVVVELARARRRPRCGPAGCAEAGLGAVTRLRRRGRRRHAWSRITQAQIQLDDGEQRSLLGALSASAIDATVVFRTQRVLNAIALEVEESAIPVLEGLPGVKAVHPLVLHTLSNATSVPWIGAPAAWSGFGATGKGVRIGIIDTGIDYLHRHFGGSGSYAGQSFDDSVVPWNAKVVGGTDLVGDDYDGSASSASPTAIPWTAARTVTAPTSPGAQPATA